SGSRTPRRLAAACRGGPRSGSLGSPTPIQGAHHQMAPLAPSRNIAARMGRWSANHWKTATFGWLAFVLAAFAIGNALGTKQIDTDKSGSGESGHVTSVLSDEFKQSASETVLVQSSSHTVDDAS